MTGIYPNALPRLAKETGLEVLDLDCTTAAVKPQYLHKLPKLGHKDPFDRILAWQAIRNNYCLLTKDREFTEYQTHGLQVVW